MAVKPIIFAAVAIVLAACKPATLAERQQQCYQDLNARGLKGYYLVWKETKLFNKQGMNTFEAEAAGTRHVQASAVRGPDHDAPSPQRTAQ